jgi:hypothetical protein
VAALCGEHLLAAGAILVVEGAEGLFAEWHSRILELVRQDQRSRVQLILAAAGIYALYGIAGLAWTRRRWAALGLVVRGMASHPERHVYPFLMDNGNAVITANWLVDGLGQSQILRRLEPDLPSTAERVVGLISGLAVTRWLAGMDDADLSRIVGADARGQQLGFPDYPALYDRFFGWAEELAKACLSSSEIEKGLEQVIPVRGKSGVAGTCAHILPALGCLMSMNRGTSPFDWFFDVDKNGRWAEWMETRFPKVMST